jgi:hypothetical protein
MLGTMIDMSIPPCIRLDSWGSGDCHTLPHPGQTCDENQQE